jgi:hypothetical protein
VVKKNTTKTKLKQLSKEMIGAPQSDLTHTFHLGVSGETFGDVACLNTVEQTPSPIEPIVQSVESPSVRTESFEVGLLFDEVMQAFTEIYPHEEDDLSMDPAVISVSDPLIMTFASVLI